MSGARHQAPGTRHERATAKALRIRGGRVVDPANKVDALRDVLFASALPRHLPTTWFASKSGARPRERRR